MSKITDIVDYIRTLRNVLFSSGNNDAENASRLENSMNKVYPFKVFVGEMTGKDEAALSEEDFDEAVECIKTATPCVIDIPHPDLPDELVWHCIPTGIDYVGTDTIRINVFVGPDYIPVYKASE